MKPKIIFVIVLIVLIGSLCSIDAKKNVAKLCSCGDADEGDDDAVEEAEIGRDSKSKYSQPDPVDDDNDDAADDHPEPTSHGKSSPADDDDDKLDNKRDDDNDDDDGDTKVEDAEDGDSEEGEEGAEERTYNIAEIFHLDEENQETRRRKELLSQTALHRLQHIVENQIHPIEKAYKYEQLSMSSFGEAEIFAKPLVLIMEPYKRGRSSIIPVLLGDVEVEDGEEPENSDFVIYSYAAKPRTLEGIQILRNETFESLQRFGKSLASHLKAIETPNPLLERMSFVETPDILENSKLDKEYPMSKVHQWFVARADAVILVVEPDRLDVGETLEAVFRELKDQEDLLFVLVESGYKSTLDDSIKALRRLAWSFAPHFDVNDAPKMYLTSFEKPLDGECSDLYARQEKQFLVDLNKVLDHRFKNRLNTVFERSVNIRNHALLVDKYVDTFTQKKSFFGNNKVLENDLINFPAKFSIYESVLRRSNASADDLPEPAEYKAFFGINPLPKFNTLASSCSFLKGCPADKLNYAIQFDLPELLEKFQQRLPLCLSDVSECTLEEKRYVPEKKKKKSH